MLQRATTFKEQQQQQHIVTHHKLLLVEEQLQQQQHQQEQQPLLVLKYFYLFMDINNQSSDNREVILIHSDKVDHSLNSILVRRIDTRWQNCCRCPHPFHNSNIPFSTITSCPFIPTSFVPIPTTISCVYSCFYLCIVFESHCVVFFWYRSIWTLSIYSLVKSLPLQSLNHNTDDLISKHNN
jgi:hypothetical protein